MGYHIFCYYTITNFALYDLWVNILIRFIRKNSRTDHFYFVLNFRIRHISRCFFYCHCLPRRKKWLYSCLWVYFNSHINASFFHLSWNQFIICKYYVETIFFFKSIVLTPVLGFILSDSFCRFSQHLNFRWFTQIFLPSHVNITLWNKAGGLMEKGSGTRIYSLQVMALCRLKEELNMSLPLR